MNILSVTIIPPGEDAQWWRIINIVNQLKLVGYKVDLVHYILKGFDAHKIIKSKNYETSKVSFVVSSVIKIPFIHLRKVMTGRYNLVYGNTYGGTFFCILGKFCGVPLILDMHGVSEEFLLDPTNGSSYKLFLLRFMEFLSLRASDKVLCVSKKMIYYLNKEKNIPLDKMIYATNGVDLNFFKNSDEVRIKKLRESFNFKNKIVFGYIGGFQYYQGVEKLVEAAKKVMDTRAKFLIIGGVNNSIEGNVLFIPSISRDEICDYYSICDVLVLPRPSYIGTEVAAPTKFAEYCAMGKPILTTNVGDAADFVRQYKNGIVVLNNDPDNLQKGILEFLKLDHSTFIEMGKNSRKLAEDEFSWKKISENIIKGVNGSYEGSI